MLILVSPAKTLDYENAPKTQVHTTPSLLDYSGRLIEVCRELSPADIATLMKVSDKIAGLNAARFSEWQPDFNLENAKQAVFAFRGDVYTGLDADSLSDSELEQAQKQLRILSGLYGLLRPLDLMQPYRLEMGTKLTNPEGSNLYQFWGDVITQEINRSLEEQGSELVVNLASNEYFKSVNKKLLKANLVTPVFKDCKNGQYKVISFYAKKARGLMARYIIQNQLTDAEALKGFDLEGYYYSEEQSKPNEPVFLREER